MEIKEITNQIIEEAAKKALNQVDENQKQVAMKIEELEKNMKGLNEVLYNLKTDEKELTSTDKLLRKFKEDANELKEVLKNKKYEFTAETKMITPTFGAIFNPAVDRNKEIIPQRLLLYDLLQRRTIARGQTGVSYIIGNTITNPLNTVNEGFLKNGIDQSYLVQVDGLRTIAYFQKFSEQVMTDFEQLVQDVNYANDYNLKLQIDKSILVDHIESNASTVTFTGWQGPKTTAPNIMDLFEAVAWYIERITDYYTQRPNLLIVPYKEYYDLKLTKDSTNNYLIDKLIKTDVIVFPSKYLAPNTCIIGNTNAAIIYTDGEIRGEFWRSSDDFEKNMVTYRAEQRLAVIFPYNYRFQWAKVANINAALTAITK